MAKRFGRNQKRRMREQITELEAQASLERNGRLRAAQDASHFRGELNTLRMEVEVWARRIAALFGDKSPILREIETHDLPAAAFVAAVRGGMKMEARPARIYPSGPDDRPRFAAMEFMKVFALEADAQADPLQERVRG